MPLRRSNNNSPRQTKRWKKRIDNYISFENFMIRWHQNHPSNSSSSSILDECLVKTPILETTCQILDPIPMLLQSRDSWYRRRHKSELDNVPWKPINIGNQCWETNDQVIPIQLQDRAVAKDREVEEFEICLHHRVMPSQVLLGTMANAVEPCLLVKHLPCSHPVAIALLEVLAITFSNHQQDILVVDTEGTSYLAKLVSCFVFHTWWWSENTM